MGARAVQTGQVFLVWKVILEFSAGPPGRANLSVMTDEYNERPDTQFTENFVSFPMTLILSQSDI